jgi:RimJ/RimL family protein N-acetyltransferase
MIFTKGNIALRPFKSEDFGTTLSWRQDIELRKLAQFHSFPITAELEQDWIDSVLKSRSDKVIYYAIENTEEKKIIGYFNLRDINWIHRVAWMGIIIGDLNSRGRGYGTVSLELGIRYTFDYLNLWKISLEVLSENKAAVALYLKSGFVEEGLLKKQIFFEAKYHDLKIMSLFNNEMKVL